jgi:hypothetical protein
VKFTASKLLNKNNNLNPFLNHQISLIIQQWHDLCSRGSPILLYNVFHWLGISFILPNKIIGHANQFGGSA